MKDFYSVPSTILGFRFINNKAGLSCSSSNPPRGPQSTFQMGQEVEQTCRASATNKPPKNSQSCDGPIEELHEPLPCCRSAVLIGLFFFLETQSKLYEAFQQNLRRPPLGQDCGRNFLVDDEFLI